MKMIVKNIPTICSSIKEHFPAICSCITACVTNDNRCKLRCQLQQMDNRECDMIKQLKAEEASNLCNKQKAYVGTYFEQIKRFKVKAYNTLKELEEGGLWNRAYMLLQLDGLLKEGKQLLKKADQLMNEGLTRCEVYTRGMRLPVGNLIGNTSQTVQEEALRSIKNKAHTIGIHGNLGAGKTTLMKFLYNDVYDDHENFKAVFWAGAPQEEKPNIKSIQNCVADAMKFKLEDEDVVRRSSLLARKLKDMGGHVVIFLDNVKEPFVMYEVGIPVGCNEDKNFCCTLVFTAASEDVCNKMRSVKFKMDLLPEHEARELFLHEAGRSHYCTRSFGRRLEMVAVDVAKQCARMPLVITLIARSMTGKEDLCEWKNRLNELMGVVEDMHGDEAKILEQLKFSYNCIKDYTIRGCFIDSASVLLEGHRLTRQKLIKHWVQQGRISRKCRRGTSPTASAIYDHGHTIINELQRMYLLEIVELDGTEYVSMNKWIRKMAEIVPSEEVKP